MPQQSRSRSPNFQHADIAAIVEEGARRRLSAKELAKEHGVSWHTVRAWRLRYKQGLLTVPARIPSARASIEAAVSKQSVAAPKADMLLAENRELRELVLKLALEAERLRTKK